MSIDVSRLTILVNTCDQYSDIWPLFFAAFNEYWPACNYNVVVNTELLSAKLPGNVSVHNFNPSSGAWGLRLRKTLQSINTEYVLALYDDFILEDRVDDAELRELLDRMDEDKNIAVIYLTKLGLLTKVDRSLFPESKIGNKYAQLADTIDYRLNSAPGLWRRDDLLSYTGAQDNPWAWEVFGTYRTFAPRKKFYCPSVSERDIYSYNYSKGGAIYRGKWVRQVVEDKNNKYNLAIDFSRRGFSDSALFEKRSLRWKVEFILLGYRMVGVKVFIFICRALKSKFLWLTQ